MHSRYGFLRITDVYIHNTFSPSRHSYSRDSSSTPWSHSHCLATTYNMRATIKNFSVLLLGWKSSHSSHTTTVFTTSKTLKTQQPSKMTRFGNLFGSGFRSDRSSSRRNTHGGYDNYGRSSSSRLNEPFSMPYGDYRTTSRREESDNSTLHRAASQREPYDNRYNYRDVSPIRTSERPRAFTHKHAYDDHRSVSPLGTSRFEQPSMATRQFSASNMGGTLSDRTPSYATNSRDTPRSTSFRIDRGYDGYSRPETSGGGFFGSSAGHGGDASRRMGNDERYGSTLGREHRPNVGSNFRHGGFGWDLF
jgi:hypothetical protein